MSNLKNLTGPLSSNNPVIVQILGICSALAVTVKMEPAFVMGISVTAKAEQIPKICTITGLLALSGPVKFFKLLIVPLVFIC